MNKGVCALPALLLAALTNHVYAQSLPPSEQCETPDEICVLPKEESLCRVDFFESCTSAVCYDSDFLCQGLAPEEFGFLGICLVAEALAKLQNCNFFIGPNTESDRVGATDCYGDHGIDVAEPVRGNCEAGGCCATELPLCELERYFFFMALGYGVAQSDDSECSSSLDYFGPDSNCTFLSDGKSNDAVVCSNAGITEDDDGRNYCDITFSGTNDAIDILRELFHLFDPTSGRTFTFGSGDNEISFTALKNIADIGFGSDDSSMDGIVEIAYQEAADKGCFEREGAAIHFMAHSLGAAMANFFVLKLAAEYPEVYVKMTTAGEPSTLLEALEGKAASLQAWSNKERYINGRVLPRGQVFENLFLPREYGLYQDYCWVSQVLPGGFVAQGEETKLFFLCEVLEDDNLVYFIAGPKGCAADRGDVVNELPNFPHRGGVDFFGEEDAADLEELKSLLKFIGLDGLDDIVDFFNVVTTIADMDFREAFYQVIDLHFLRRSVHTLNLLYQDGAQCSATRQTIPLPAPTPPLPCPPPSPDGCFSPENTVEEMDQGSIAMKDLKIGSQVMNGHGSFDRVYSFGHFSPNKEAEYLQIYVSGLNNPLEISKEHMLFVEGSPIPASNVVVGNKVGLGVGGVAEVKSIKRVVRSGAFAPFTTSGTIVVSGVVVSNYVSLQGDSEVLLIGNYSTPLSMHWLSHVFQAPHRLVCMLGYCESETYTDEGLSNWVVGPLHASEWLLEQNAVIMTILFVPAFLLGLLTYAVESAFRAVS